MKGRKSAAVALFLGALLTVIFAVGIAWTHNPGILAQRRYYDATIDRFITFCANVWLPAGIIGIPLFLISLTVSLIREKKNK